MQEDLLNPCNGETIHFTTTYHFSTTFFTNGGEADRFTARGSGIGDRGTHYTRRVMAQARIAPGGKEHDTGIEHVVGSVPGSSFTDMLRIFVFAAGSGTVHSAFRHKVRCD